MRRRIWRFPSVEPHNPHRPNALNEFCTTLSLQKCPLPFHEKREYRAHHLHLGSDEEIMMHFMRPPFSSLHTQGCSSARRAGKPRSISPVRAFSSTSSVNPLRIVRMSRFEADIRASRYRTANLCSPSIKRPASLAARMQGGNYALRVGVWLLQEVRINTITLHSVEVSLARHIPDRGGIRRLTVQVGNEHLLFFAACETSEVALRNIAVVGLRAHRVSPCRVRKEHGFRPARQEAGITAGRRPHSEPLQRPVQ